MVDRGTAPAQQRILPVAQQRGDAPGGAAGERPPGNAARLRERGVERSNLWRARARVQTTGGSPGIDGMTVEEVPASLRQPWPTLRAARLAGTYRPRPVKRGEVPTPSGGVRKLGSPTGLDRGLHHALLHVLPPAGEQTFAEGSSGLRPRRSAPQALARAQAYLAEGYSWGGALERATFCARVHQAKRMRRGKERRTDRRGVQRIARDLQAGALTGEGGAATTAGPPPGGPRSPRFATRLLDSFDQALERRGHRCVRSADDSHRYVKSARAGQRVLARGTRCLERRLQRTVTAAKRAVDRPWCRTLLGLTCTRRRPPRRQVSPKALKALQQEGRQRTGRTRGVALPRVVAALRQSLEGWHASLRVADGQAPFQERDAWGRRRLRGDVWQPWGRRRDRELRQRGSSPDRAWPTCQSAHGPWRLSRSPALAIARPGQPGERVGVPRLSPRSRHCHLPPNRRRRDPSVRWCGRREVVRPPPIPIAMAAAVKSWLKIFHVFICFLTWAIGRDGARHDDG